MRTKRADSQTGRLKLVNVWLYWHRWIGVIACIGMVLWGLSGASHPIMTRLQPVPKHMMPPLQLVDLSAAKALPQVLSDHHIAQFNHISLATLAGVSYYRVSLPKQAEALYLDVVNGVSQSGLESAHAIDLACYYTGLPASAVKAVRKIDTFETDYHPVNRLLPVWRVDFEAEGDLRAYVDTEQSRLATLVDNRRAWLTAWFQFGHQWSFMQAAGVLQLVAATLVLALILASAMTGLSLYIRQAATARYRLPRFSLQWWHRQLGLWVAMVILLLASSGLWHLWQSDAQQHRPSLVTQYVVNSAALNSSLWQQFIGLYSQTNVRKLDIYGQHDQLFWQVIHAGEALPTAQVAAMHQHGHAKSSAPMSTPALYGSSGTQLKTLNAAGYASLWMAHLAGLPNQPLQQVAWITHFANEYGFIFKRLPVLKLQTTAHDGQRWYVEPATGTVAAAINQVDGLEGFVFAYLHKWSLQSLPKDLRDAIAVLAALLIAAMGIMGGILFAKARV